MTIIFQTLWPHPLRIALALLALLGAGWFGWSVGDRRIPVEDIMVRIMPAGGVFHPGEDIQVEASSTYLLECTAKVSRELRDSRGVIFSLPEVGTMRRVPGRQVRVARINIPIDFAPGIGTYHSEASYSCTWFQQVFWPMTLGNITRSFYVEPR